MAKKFLDDNGLLYFWGKIKATFALIGHTHSKDDIRDFPTTIQPSSHTHGQISNFGEISTTVAIGDQDKLIISDYSNNNALKGTTISFDGSTTTKALTPKGTWETFLTSADVPEGASASTTTPKELGANNHPNGYVGEETAFARGDHVHPLSPVFTAATGTAAGKVGLVPAPSSGQLKLLTSLSNTWETPNMSKVTLEKHPTYQFMVNGSRNVWSLNIDNASTNTDGYMSATDKDKLDGIEAGAEANALEGVQMNGTDLTITSKKVNIPVFTGSSTVAAGSVGLVPAPSKMATNASTKILTEWGTWNSMLITYTASTRKLAIGFEGNDSVESVTLPLASTSAGGLMSSTDKSKLNSISMTNGVIDSSCLPSFVDDVIEAYARTNQTELGSTWLATGSATGTVITPEAGKIYVLMNSSTNYEANTQFRWGGTAYVQLNDSGCTAITNAEIDAIVAS